MPSCCAVNCCNRTEKGFRMFKLPQGSANIDRQKLWIRNIGRADQLPERPYLCQVHFTEDQFEQGRADGKKLLRWSGVPTLFEHRKHPNPRKPPIKRVLLEPNTNSAVQVDEHDMKEQENEDNADEENTENEYNRNLKRQLKAALKKINILECKIVELQNNLKKVFNPDQQKFFFNNSMQGSTWSDETIQKGLKLYMSCGKNGYDEIRRQQLPYPSIRTLQANISNFKFKPGILDDVKKYNLKSKNNVEKAKSSRSMAMREDVKK